MKVKKVSKPALHADTYSVACVVNNNAEVLENALNRIKALEREPFKDAYIKQVVKERDIAIGQLDELGYSLGEKIRPREEEPTLDKLRAEIEAQEKWLRQAGCNAYNVSLAFNSIKRALGK